MSDDEEEYEYDYGSDGYQSDTKDEMDGGESDELIEIENLFYEGDDEKVDNPAAAIEKFERVVQLETSRGQEVKWRFKALQNLVVLNQGLGRFQEMINRYSEMLSYIHVATRNECTDAINIILDSIANTSDTTVLSQMYEHTLVALKSANNERLWFTTNLKLARVSLDSRRLEKVEEVLGTLKEALSSSSGSSDPAKGNNLLEVYCLEIQLCSVTLDFGRMRDIYPKTLNLTTTVSDPRTLAVIRENGGKLYMAEENWDAAYNELYQAFRNYQEAGNVRARDCLKYVVLASMLALTDINPFAAREAKVFAEDKEIMAMSELRDSLESNDLSRFERILKNKQNRILDEPFLMRYIEPLRRRMQEQAILNAVKPFRKVTIQFLADRLSLTTEEIERILVDLILDEKLDGLIDQSCGHVCINPLKRDVHADKQKHIADWIASLNTINQDFDNRMA